jgi:hypothetical protein
LHTLFSNVFLLIPVECMSPDNLFDGHVLCHSSLPQNLCQEQGAAIISVRPAISSFLKVV